jgi:O-antigen ligase
MISGLGISCLVFDIYDQKHKFWTIVKILVIASVLILTKSRSSLIGLLLILFFHVKNSGNLKLQLATYIGVLAVIPYAVNKLILRKGGLDEVFSMTGRLPFWKALLTEGLPREPLLGFGFMRIDYKDTFSSIHTYTAHMTHNTFMQVLMNLGFIGFTIVLFQMVFTIRGFIKEGRQKRLMLLGILIPVLINSFTEFGIFGDSNYGILFYQLMIFSISFGEPSYLSRQEKEFLLRKNTFLAKSLY